MIKKAKLSRSINFFFNNFAKFLLKNGVIAKIFLPDETRLESRSAPRSPISDGSGRFLFDDFPDLLGWESENCDKRSISSPSRVPCWDGNGSRCLPRDLPDPNDLVSDSRSILQNIQNFVKKIQFLVIIMGNKFLGNSFFTSFFYNATRLYKASRFLTKIVTYMEF